MQTVAMLSFVMLYAMNSVLWNLNPKLNHSPILLAILQRYQILKNKKAPIFLHTANCQAQTLNTKFKILFRILIRKTATTVIMKQQYLQKPGHIKVRLMVLRCNCHSTGRETRN